MNRNEELRILLESSDKRVAEFKQKAIDARKGEEEALK